MQVLSRQLPNVVDNQALTDVEYCVAAVQTWIVHVGTVAVAARCTGGGGSRVVPRRAVINGMAPSVVKIKQHVVAHLPLQLRLQSVVGGVVCVLPLAQDAVVNVGNAPVQTANGSVNRNIVRNARTYRQQGTILPIDLLGAEQPVPDGSYPIQFQHHPGCNLFLQAQELVVNVGIFDSSWQHNSRQECRVRIVGGPS